jgi:hypothetical protein
MATKDVKKKKKAYVSKPDFYSPQRIGYLYLVEVIKLPFSFIQLKKEIAALRYDNVLNSDGKF